MPGMKRPWTTLVGLAVESLPAGAQSRAQLLIPHDNMPYGFADAQ
jgi:hypothetical protein